MNPPYFDEDRQTAARRDREGSSAPIRCCQKMDAAINGQEPVMEENAL